MAEGLPFNPPALPSPGSPNFLSPDGQPESVKQVNSHLSHFPTTAVTSCGWWWSEVKGRFSTPRDGTQYLWLSVPVSVSGCSRKCTPATKIALRPDHPGEQARALNSPRNQDGRLLACRQHSCSQIASPRPTHPAWLRAAATLSQGDRPTGASLTLSQGLHRASAPNHKWPRNGI